MECYTLDRVIKKLKNHFELQEQLTIFYENLEQMSNESEKNFKENTDQKNENNIKQKMIISTNINNLFIFDNINCWNSKVEFVKYIVELSFSKRNSFLHVMDCYGNLLYHYSAGKLCKYFDDWKRKTLLGELVGATFHKLTFLKNQPVALHFKISHDTSQVEFNKFWLVQKLKWKLFVKTICFFETIPYNGCWKKKMKWKKVRTKRTVLKNQPFYEEFSFQQTEKNIDNKKFNKKFD